MDISPLMYHLLVRPKFFTKKHIHSHILEHFDLNQKKVLDFGAGTGANCSLFSPEHYIGVDPDKRRVFFARKWYPQYTFHVLENSTLTLDEHSIDYIFIISVLHHISSEEIARYLRQFRSILKPEGKIVSIEPFFCRETPFRNKFMRWYDSGNFIREEQGYLDLFHQNGFRCNVFKRFRKFYVYNELFFTAVPDT